MILGMITKSMMVQHQECPRHCHLILTRYLMFTVTETDFTLRFVVGDYLTSTKLNYESFSFPFFLLKTFERFQLTSFFFRVVYREIIFFSSTGKLRKYSINFIYFLPLFPFVIFMSCCPTCGDIDRCVLYVNF